MGYLTRLALFGLVIAVGCLAFGGSAGPRGDSATEPGGPTEPVRHGVARSADMPPPGPKPHPLEPALEIARKCLANIEQNVHDYSATLVKREQVGGKQSDPEELLLRVRHQPFSVYTEFVLPESLKGQKAVYVEGRNGGNLVARGAGLKGLIGNISLDPRGYLAMNGQRYPIMEIGILNLTRRLIEVAEQDARYGECEVNFLKGVKVGDRTCTCIEVVHPEPRRVFRFYKAQVFIDDELDIPIRYQAFDWPATPGGEPPLLEQYTYRDVKLNNGFTDADFELP